MRPVSGNTSLRIPFGRSRPRRGQKRRREGGGAGGSQSRDGGAPLKAPGDPHTTQLRALRNRQGEHLSDFNVHTGHPGSREHHLLICGAGVGLDILRIKKTARWCGHTPSSEELTPAQGRALVYLCISRILVYQTHNCKWLLG